VACITSVREERAAMYYKARFLVPLT